VIDDATVNELLGQALELRNRIYFKARVGSEIEQWANTLGEVLHALLTRLNPD